MPVILRTAQITTYSDANGNSVTGTPAAIAGSLVEFKGSNCSVVFGDRVMFHGVIIFHRDNCTVRIGSRSSFRGRITLGLGCDVSLGTDIYCGPDLQINTAEGADVTIGNDLLISTRIRIKADDSHPIYDGVTGERINKSASITIGDHVWIGEEVFILPGSSIGSGSVIGARSVVTKSRPIPPDSLALGTPARVHRSKIYWARKHLQQSPDIAASVPPRFEPDEPDSPEDLALLVDNLLIKEQGVSGEDPAEPVA
jgi:acetyltransferase-like isoleucine patch superfamily enzyme